MINDAGKHDVNAQRTRTESLKDQR
jgi:hypothetical protein